MQELTYDFPLFVGVILAAICLAVAALVYVVALPGSPALALAYGLAALAAAFLGTGGLATAAVAVFSK